jgi:hypothetical protein
MDSIKATLLALIALSLGTAGASRVYGGPVTYTWAASAGGDITYVEYQPQTGNYVDLNVPVTPGVVQVTWDPYLYSFSLAIIDSPGFIAGAGLSVWITAPPPGCGDDCMVFTSLIGDFEPGYATVTLFAPNGTLSSPGQAPASLDAFTAGTYEYNVPGDPGQGFYTLGQASGILQAVPEPSTIALMTIGMSFSSCLVAASQRRRRRVSRAGSLPPVSSAAAPAVEEEEGERPASWWQAL